jgi:DNA-binding PadR family transcriptional regulator
MSRRLAIRIGLGSPVAHVVQPGKPTGGAHETLDVLFVYNAHTKETSMPTAAFLGEWEQLVLLSLLQLGTAAYVLPLRAELTKRVGRPVSRGALYRTLDRLEQKDFLTWTLVDPDGPARGGHPRRRFRVTAKGIRALRASKQALTDLWAGLEVLE